MEAKAKSVGFCTDEHDPRIRYGFFVYRGREYMVRYAGWLEASDEAPWMQHKREQERIDREIDCPDVPPTEEEMKEIEAKWQEVWRMIDSWGEME